MLALPFRGILITQEYGGAQYVARQAYISQISNLETHGSTRVEIIVRDLDDNGQLGVLGPEPDGDVEFCDEFAVSCDLDHLRALPAGERVLRFLDLLHEGVMGLATARGWPGVDQLVAAREHWGDTPFTRFQLEVEKKRCRWRPTLTATLLAIFSLEGMSLVTVIHDDHGSEIARSRSLLAPRADLAAIGTIPVRVVWRDQYTAEMSPTPGRSIRRNKELLETVQLTIE